jgi:hypothetical protein
MKREGFSLLEVVLSLAILTGAVVVLGELVRSGLRSAQLARDLSQAELHCETIAQEIAAGALPAQPVERSPIDYAPGWFYSIESVNSSMPTGASSSGMNGGGMSGGMSGGMGGGMSGMSGMGGGMTGGGAMGGGGGGLLRLKITVEQNPDFVRPARYSLVQWFRDPSLIVNLAVPPPSAFLQSTANMPGTTGMSGTTGTSGTGGAF